MGSGHFRPPWWRRVLGRIVAFAFVMALLSGAGGYSRKTVRIPAGSFQPMYGTEPPGLRVEVQPFRIDVLPVLNLEFHRFTVAYPEWRKARVFRLFADGGYLGEWKNTSEASPFPPDFASSPVTNVSWFAAQAFCRSHGGRLPTVLEWEFVASASETKADASRDPDFVEQLLRWYSNHNEAGQLADVRHAKKNFYRVQALHGYVWEWVSDFNSIFIAADNRKDGTENKNNFCGAGSAAAADKANYAAFMRYALRSSLGGTFTLRNLGFRCAYDE